MFCGLRLARVTSIRNTTSETGYDEMYFKISGGAPSLPVTVMDIRPRGSFGGGLRIPTLRHSREMTLLCSRNLTQQPAFGGDDIAFPTFGLRTEARRIRWVTLSEQKWVILAKRRGPDYWLMPPNRTVHNIMLWEGFIPENQTANILVEVWEQEGGAHENIGRFTVSMRSLPHPAPPVIEWFSASIYTRITGAAAGAATSIAATASGAHYNIDAAVDRGSTLTCVHSSKCLDVAGGIINERKRSAVWLSWRSQSKMVL